MVISKVGIMNRFSQYNFDINGIRQIFRNIFCELSKTENDVKRCFPTVWASGDRRWVQEIITLYSTIHACLHGVKEQSLKLGTWGDNRYLVLSLFLSIINICVNEFLLLYDTWWIKSCFTTQRWKKKKKKKMNYLSGDKILVKLLSS